MKIFTRYEIITSLITDNGFEESLREMIAKLPDEVLFNEFGKQQFKELRKGYYTIN